MNPPNPTLPNFNRIARPYRFLEYITLGKSLENCRNLYLPQLLDRHSALVIGDGDGRFLAQLFAKNPHLKADAVDTSATMLQLLRERCEATTPDAKARLCTHHANALTFPLEDTKSSYDLIVTHFFLDCLTQPELNNLIHRIAKTVPSGTLWLISDFRIPSGSMRFPAKLLIRSLYLAFRILTGLRTTHLPDHVAPLTQAGFVLISHQHRLAGILDSELWRS
jgi:SAM-dependent methyltransferase